MQVLHFPKKLIARSSLVMHMGKFDSAQKNRITPVDKLWLRPTE